LGSPEVTTTLASRANTATGAVSMIRSTIFRTTSFRASKKSFSGFEAFSPISSMEIPRKMVKKITCSIRLLSLKAPKALSGTISSRNWRGPLCVCREASASFEVTSALEA